MSKRKKKKTRERFRPWIRHDKEVYEVTKYYETISANCRKTRLHYERLKFIPSHGIESFLVPHSESLNKLLIKQFFVMTFLCCTRDF